ncbi:MAG: flagellar hook-length control protein FliK, partial [Deltaproteobacteria bacterium]|nr:flagellar hook-length control protein FliK [Deltaproteobacteria bacterium]
ELGRLDVELKVVKDKMTAHIRAESAETFEALEKEIASLKASLKEAGLEMNLTLSYDGQAESDRRFSRTAPEAMTAAGRSQGAGEAEDVPPAAWTVSRDSRLLDRVI